MHRRVMISCPLRYMVKGYSLMTLSIMVSLPVPFIFMISISTLFSILYTTALIFLHILFHILPGVQVEEHIPLRAESSCFFLRHVINFLVLEHSVDSPFACSQKFLNMVQEVLAVEGVKGFKPLSKPCDTGLMSTCPYPGFHVPYIVHLYGRHIAGNNIGIL